MYEIGSLADSATLISQMVLRKSTNDGASWTQYKPTAQESYAHAVLPHPTNDAIIYLGGYFVQSGTYYPVIFKTTDRGATWNKLGSSTFTQSWEEIQILECDNLNPNKVFVGSNRSLYASTDGGASWVRILNNVNVSGLVIDPANSNYLYVGTRSGGVTVSTNGGTTWTGRNENLGSLDVESMAYDGANGVLYVGTMNSGVYRLSIAAPALSIPQPPALLVPADQAVNVQVNSALTWNPSSGATQYHLQVSTTNTFTLLQVNDSTLTGTSKTMSSLAPGVGYYWRVRAMNVLGWGAYSSARIFTTAYAAPQAPNLDLPADNAINIPLNAMLSWMAVSGATQYHLQLSTVYSFFSLLVNDSTITGTSRTVGPLSVGTTYYWRVSATNVSAASAYSPVRSFTTIVAAPQMPTLASPADGAVNQPTTIALSWSASAGATSYRVQVSANAGFAPMVVDDSTVTMTTRQAGPLANNLTYYWRVSARNVGGASAYSPVRSFTTIVAAPQAPGLVSPEANAINVSLNPTLSWNASTGATRYHVQVSLTAAFVSNIVDDSTIVGTTRVIGPLSYGTMYLWQVRAINAGGASGFSGSRQFRTMLASAVERLDGSIPEKFALYQNYPNPFNPSTTITFAVPKSGFVRLSVFNLLGGRVALLVSQELPVGYYKTTWSAADMPSGVYVYRLEAEGFVKSKKLTLLR